MTPIPLVDIAEPNVDDNDNDNNKVDNNDNDDDNNEGTVLRGGER